MVAPGTKVQLTMTVADFPTAIDWLVEQLVPAPVGGGYPPDAAPEVPGNPITRIASIPTPIANLRICPTLVDLSHPLGDHSEFPALGGIGHLGFCKGNTTG